MDGRGRRRCRIRSAFVLGAILATAIAPEGTLADEVGWTVQFGTAVNDAAMAVAVRGRRVYVAGGTQGGLPGQASAGGRDVFLQRYSSRGELQWTRQFGTGGADQVTAGALGARGNRVVVGGFVTGALPGQTAAGDNDAFLRAYDREGNVLWTRQFGTPGLDQVRSIAIAVDRSIFVAGQTAGQLTPEPSAGLQDAFAMRLDPDGTVRWLRQFGTSGVDTAFGIEVTDDAVYVAGSTDSFFPGQANAGDFDNYVARLTLDGDLEWITQFGTPALDATWKIGMTGSTIFVSGHTEGTFAGQTSFGRLDGFLAALDPEGHLTWVRQFGTTGCDQMFGLAVDTEGAVLAGEVDGPPPCSVSGNTDAFARKYDVDGNVLWSLRFGTAARDSLQGVALRGGSVYLAGVTGGSLPGHANLGGNDAFVMRTRDVEDDEGEEEEN